jgi:hypothetical protein
MGADVVEPLNVDPFDMGELRPLREPLKERLQVLLSPLGKNLYRSIREILDGSRDIQRHGSKSCVVAKEDALHQAEDPRFKPRFVCHSHDCALCASPVHVLGGARGT